MPGDYCTFHVLFLPEEEERGDRLACRLAGNVRRRASLMLAFCVPLEHTADFAREIGSSTNDTAVRLTASVVEMILARTL
jgi:hypothetical protein